MKIKEYASADHSRIAVNLIVNALDNIAPSRYSAVLVNQLAYIPYQGMNDLYQFIVPEIAHLEDKTRPTQTVKEGSFNRPDMKGLYKKHFYIWPFLAKNVQDSWQLSGNGKSTEFEDTFKKELGEYYKNQSAVKAQEFISENVKTLIAKASKAKKTGEYIIYQKHNNQNYYLCLGFHGQDEEILKCAKYARKDFPFLETEKGL